MVIRIVYLALVPALVAYALNYVWRRWRPDDEAEDRLQWTLAGVVAGVMLLSAVTEAQRKYHYECTQVVDTGEEQECVGRYVRVPGPDREQVFAWLVGSVVAFWLGARAPQTSSGKHPSAAGNSPLSE